MSQAAQCAIGGTRPGPAGLYPAEIASTVASMAAVQLASGMIPWYPGGHADPWNHTEAAMALAAGGLVGAAERAYAWLADRQHPDGSWCSYYQARGVEEPRRDTNMCAYVATGVWFHYLLTGDSGFLEEMWPVVARAVGFVLAHQRAGGELTWAVDPDGRPARHALLAASSSVRLSLRCALAAAARLGREHPEWELSAARLEDAIASCSPRTGRTAGDRFEPKERWSMDWYYPVLAGGVTGVAGAARLAGRWDELVVEGVGVRCVSGSDWVTTAETAECAIAADSVGLGSQAALLLGWTRALRDDDGAYWTGMVHPGGGHFPGGERSTYSAAAVVLATHVLHRRGPGAALFAGSDTVADASQDPQAAAGGLLHERA